jgi:hypothetical protein
MTDFLDSKRKEIDDRLAELRPMVDEYQRLEKAAAALAGVGSNGASGRRTRSAAKRGPGRPKGSSSGKRGRPRGSGTRSIQALELVTSNPGVTIPELATQMGIKQNYLYRVLPSLQKDGKVKKQGKGWHPAG